MGLLKAPRQAWLISPDSGGVKNQEKNLDTEAVSKLSLEGGLPLVAQVKASLILRMHEQSLAHIFSWVVKAEKDFAKWR